MRNIIITGGELFNKGAQAMTFIAVDEMKRRFPGHQIFLLSEMDLQRSKEEREKYAFEFMGWYPLKFARCQTNPALRGLCLLRNNKELLEAEKIYRNTDLMIDISGYALGSNWSEETCNHYLDPLEFAKAFHIPIYLMPQSFGPFDFYGKAGKKIEQRIKRLLPTARAICAREEEGYRELRNRYHLQNVILANDMVVNNSGINLDHIYCKVPVIELPDILPESVAIIPNQRNYAVANKGQVQKLYISLIKYLLQNDLAVYLLSHSDIDKEICEDLKNEFCSEKRVILIDHGLNCIEFNELVKQFQFIIASRFHAIVHAFKNGIPCIALGWATKYHELMKQFGQDEYMLDVRQQISDGDLSKVVRKMVKERNEQSSVIGEKLGELQEEDIFDIIDL